MMKNAKKSLVNVLCAVLLFSIMVFGMTGCGKEQKSDGDEKNDIEDSFDDLSEEDKEVPEEDDMEEKPEKVREKGNTLGGRRFFVEEDGSLVIIDDNMEFVWYQDASDRSINYFGGPCDVYYGEEAYDYITGDYADNGVYRKKSVFNFSEEKMEEFFDAAEEEPIYCVENMICMILHHEDIVVEDEYQDKLDEADELNTDTYYWGFFDGETFLCYNIESGSLMTWISMDGDDAAGLEDDEDDVEIVKDGKDELVEGPVGPGDSWEIEVGTRGIIIDIPLDAENVHAGSYSLSYDQGSINVEYSDSFCELTEDALEDLADYYDIWNDQSDSLSNIEPVETQVGGRDAYYCRAVDSMEYVCYIFFVDIGEENYLDVTILGSVDELSEEKAFELADLEFR